jgi:hypothetical protein
LINAVDLDFIRLAAQQHLLLHDFWWLARPDCIRCPNRDLLFWRLFAHHHSLGHTLSFTPKVSAFLNCLLDYLHMSICQAWPIMRPIAFQLNLLLQASAHPGRRSDLWQHNSRLWLLFLNVLLCEYADVCSVLVKIRQPACVLLQSNQLALNRLPSMEYHLVVTRPFILNSLDVSIGRRMHYWVAVAWWFNQFLLWLLWLYNSENLHQVVVGWIVNFSLLSFCRTFFTLGFFQDFSLLSLNDFVSKLSAEIATPNSLNDNRCTYS